MLSEELLIVVAAFGTCGLLVLGVLELIWPTRPRHPVRRRRPVPARHRGRSARTAGAPPSGQELGARRTLPQLRVPPPPAVAGGVTTVALDPPPLEPAGPRPPDTLVDECFTLQQAGRYGEVVELARAALPGADDPRQPADAHTTAALWSMVALAHQALGEHLAARSALQAAVEAAPAGERPTYQRQLGTLAGGVARRLLIEVAQHTGGDSPECVDRIRTAVAWLEHGVAAMPADAVLAELSLDAQAALWRAYERSVAARLQRQEFRLARRLLHEALADPLVPPERVEAFQDLLTRTFGAEIGYLTAHAIRCVQEAREADGLGAVQRAEALLATLGDEALSPRRREEIDRRRWWIYSRLGERRLDSCEFEAALEPLVRALGCDVGAERHEQTRLLLEQALERASDREAAIEHCDRLWAQPQER